MEMTIAEKILAEKSGRDRVKPGDVVTAKVDNAMVNDITAPLTVDALEEVGVDGVWDPSKITIIFDHDFPPTTISGARNQDELRTFAEETHISDLYGSGEGVCHQLMVEEGKVLPGQLVVGADSHTCTYGALGAFGTGIGSTDMAAVFSEGELWFKVPETIKIQIKNELNREVLPKDFVLKLAGDIGADGATYMALELSGPGLSEIDVPGRMTICNMGVEMGAKAFIVPPDEITESYIENIDGGDYSPIFSDENAHYASELSYDASEIEPMVAVPHNVDNVHPVKKYSGLDVQQAFLGSCTNGRIEDLAVAADILEGRKVDKNVRMLVAPASKRIYAEAVRRGLIDVFLSAGATIENPGCTTCWGGHLGILSPSERCISSSNRNFKGRMGSPEAEIYLGSPATVAASALYGEIKDPRDI